ncbi:MAG: phosphatidylglycerol lysyltransferase domain-containing protein [Candidatus Omnitrophota bacterium]
MEFKQLKLSDREIFESFFGLCQHRLSPYQFSNIFIWKGLFDIFYAVLNGCLCVFFKDKTGCFMYLPPLGGNPDSSVINRCFAVMDGFNANKAISRIENVEEAGLKFYRNLGYGYFVKPGDYLCLRRDIVSLKGNRFKPKRASYNYCIRQYNPQLRLFQEGDQEACLSLYQGWAGERKKKFFDPVYQAMLDDGFSCQSAAIENFSQLDFSAYVVEIKNRITGYTFGFPLNRTTFCILFEICDLDYQGISQFIFSQFCRQLSGYRYINIMDDSGLANLRRVKLSYHPVEIIPNYIIKRKANG